MSIHGDKHVKSSIYKAMKQCRWCDWFSGGSKVLPPANIVKLSLGRVQVEKGSGWKAFRQRSLLGGLEACSNGVCCWPTMLLVWAAVVLTPSGIERHRCPSYILGRLPHPPTVEPAWHSWLFPWLLCSDTFQKPAKVHTHSSLNKLGYLIHLFIWLASQLVGF